MRYKDLYAEIGKLLYAVADIDGQITFQEKQRLIEIVRTELVPAELHVDANGTDVAYYAEFQFDIEDEMIDDPESAFNSFLDFVQEHHTAFTTQMKQTCIKIVKELADAYRGTNKLEEELIAKLIKHLKEIKTKS